MASFSLPSLPDQNQLWGPSPSASSSSASTSQARLLPDEFRDIPFATFSKTEKIGRIADWNSLSPSSVLPDSNSRKSSSRREGESRTSSHPTKSGSSNGQAFSYHHADDEATFSVVDNSAKTASSGVRKGPSLGGMNRSTRGGTRGGSSSTASTGRGASSGVARAPAMGGAQAVPNISSRGRGAPRGGMAARGGRGGRFGGRDWDKPQRIREASVAVGSDWQSLEEIDFTRLGKLRLDVDLDAVEEISSFGTLYQYDRAYDRISSIKFEKPLVPSDRVRYNITTSDDPIISSIATSIESSNPSTKPSPPKVAAAATPALTEVEEGEDSEATPAVPAPIPEVEESSSNLNIYMTDAILSVLMTSTRSIYPWDIIITKKNHSLYFDKRDGGSFDFVTVNENSSDPPMEISETKEGETNKTAASIVDQAAASAKQNSINTPSALSLEATYVNQNFAFQVVDENKKSRTLKDGSNPFYNEEEESDPVASCGYRYRKFDLSSSENSSVNLIVRTEVDAILPPPTVFGKKPPKVNKDTPVDEKSFVTIKTLNEFDSRAQGAGGAPDWRIKLDSQRGAVIATEMKNNSCKLARFAVQSILAGAESMKMGYISRANPRDTSRHSILGTQWYKPKELASQMNLNLSNGWGIVRTVVDLVRNSKESMEKFVLVKDPNKPSIRLYAVPSNWPADGLDGQDVDEE